jgi:hypothetical protein
MENCALDRRAFLTSHINWNQAIWALLEFKPDLSFGDDKWIKTILLANGWNLLKQVSLASVREQLDFGTWIQLNFVLFEKNQRW